MSSREKEEWLVGLQLFLNARLRTPLFKSVCRNSLVVSVPLPLPNSQYLIDGIMWSVRDNIHWVPDAWLGIQSHLLNCSQRYAQFCERLSHSAATQSVSDTDHRENLYTCHALVQDLYLSFCVVDAFLHHTVDESRSTRSIIERELPRLVAEHMPLWDPPRSSYAHEAVEDSRALFLDLLRSWVTTGLLQPEMHRRIEEYVRHRLKTVREGLADTEEQKPTPRSGALRDGLRVLLEGTAGPSSSPATADKARTAVTDFVAAMFPHHRSEAGRMRCAHCGAIFKSILAKNAHYRYHFYNRSFQSEEKIVRLPYVSRSEYAAHEMDFGKTGGFVRTTESMIDVYKIHDKRRPRIRQAKP